MDIVRGAIAPYRRFGIEARIEFAPDPCLAYQSFMSRLDALKCYEATAKQRRYVLTHFLAPPLVENNIKFVAGYASGICKKRGVSYSNVTMLSSFGEPREYVSIVATSHEIGHLLGASHTSTPSIMHMDAGYLAKSRRLGLAPESRAQIRRCLRR